MVLEKIDKEEETVQSTIPAKAEIIEENTVNETESNNLVTVSNDTLPDYAILNPDIPMRVKVGVATEVAECLSDLIESQGLVKRGLNKKDKDAPYVLIEGWTVLGTMLGIVPVTEVIETLRNGNDRIIGFKARATLYQNPVVENGKVVDGTVLSTAEAYATLEGFQKDSASMASMAQTRALGKSYRMALSWIIKMAGYEPTPAEEMPTFKE